ncbi:LicD family protein [Aliarcobacter faecis]|uniref:LicD family protein n=1 Tax=Aliarcobacter faecis TaxID=1564138 RepID=UPI00047C31FE|nr:LicD family protein [Aliarcobacter faecis]QKF72292.1 LicD family protein [Aliarcobacter faecis]
MKNIIIFGASKFGERVFNHLKGKQDFNVIGFCDNDIKKHNTKLFDKNIYSPESLEKLDYDEIIIASSWEFEIEKQLLSMGIFKNKVNIFYSNTEELQFKDNKNIQIAEQLMFDIAELFNQNDIVYHVDHGTLLGIIRDNKILPWDIDIDFAVPALEIEKIKKLLSSYLPSYKNEYCEDNNWKIDIKIRDIVIGNEEKELPMILTIYNSISTSNINNEVLGLDLAFKYEHNDTLYWMVSKRRLNSKKEICFPAKEYIFKNKIIKIPNDEVIYLEKLYGNWKKVIKNWHYSKYTNIDYYSNS